MKKLPCNYKDDAEFTQDLLLAKAGCNAAMHKIWEKMCFKQVYKEAERWAIAYVTYSKAINDYDMARLSPTKKHMWQFAAFFSQRVRRAYQTDRYRNTHAVSFSEYGWRNTKICMIDINEELL